MGALFDLSFVCEACDTGHLRVPGSYGRCRKCDFPMGENEPDREQKLRSLNKRLIARAEGRAS